ncbi:MAG TPA: DUF4388 domain-containing protein [Pyrinomonadaceae bacterium]|nr:DUF4388 domain-containing protein [Pyrinomonadaceae bacterium]
MENIERTQFMVLTGHLDDQPLPDLLRTLRVQRRSGRLQVEYANAPGSFFFEEGQLVDAQLGSLRGLEAVYAALALDGASFNFNPLVRPPERSIDRQQQKFINDLVESPRRENLAEIRVAGGSYPAKAFGDASLPQQVAPLQLAPVAAELIAPLEERLTAVEEAINATSRRFSRERLIYALVISFLVGLTVVTAAQALLNLRQQTVAPAAAPVPVQKLSAANDAPARAANPPATPTTATTTAASSPAAAALQASGASEKTKTTDATNQAKQTTQTLKAAPAERDARKSAEGVAPRKGEGSRLIHVQLDVKKGEVVGARVLNPRPGSGEHDARAIQLARQQRRYPTTFNGTDSVKVRVWF